MASMALGGDVSEKLVKNCRCQVQATLESMESAGARDMLGAARHGMRPRGQTTRRFRWKEGRASLGCLSQSAVSLAASVCSYCAACPWALVLGSSVSWPLAGTTHCSPQPTTHAHPHHHLALLRRASSHASATSNKLRPKPSRQAANAAHSRALAALCRVSQNPPRHPSVTLTGRPQCCSSAAHFPPRSRRRHPFCAPAWYRPAACPQPSAGQSTTEVWHSVLSPVGTVVSTSASSSRQRQHGWRGQSGEHASTSAIGARSSTCAPALCCTSLRGCAGGGTQQRPRYWRAGRASVGYAVSPDLWLAGSTRKTRTALVARVLVGMHPNTVHCARHSRSMRSTSCASCAYVLRALHWLRDPC